jgi:outer membrane lipoprotein-sorting protein
MKPSYLWRVAFILLVTAILIAAPPPAAPQGHSEDARAILEKVGSTYRTASTLELKGTRIQKQDDKSDDNVDRMTFTLTTAGNKFRWEQRSNAGTMIHASDGDKRWMYTSNEFFNENKYTPLGGKSVDPFEFDIQVSLRPPASNLKEARIVGKEVLKTGQGKRTCKVIEARYEGPPRGYPQYDTGATTFRIDRESHFVWKMSVPIVIDFGKSGKVPAIVTTVYSSIRMNLQLPPETFVPPPGVKTDSGEAARERAVLAQNAATMSQMEAQLEKDPDSIRLRSGLIGEYLNLSRTDPACGSPLFRPLVRN